MDMWNKLPVWARWILYVPAVFILPMLAAGIFILLNNEFFAPGTIRFALLIMLGAALNALCFNWLALNLAPKFNKSIAWVLFCVVGLLYLLTIINAAHTWFWTPEGFSYDTVTEFLQSVVWISVGLYTLLAVTKKSSYGVVHE